MAIINGNLQLLGSGSIQNARIENLAADPTTPSVGQLWFNTTDKVYRGYNGTQVISFGSGGGDAGQGNGPVGGYYLYIADSALTVHTVTHNLNTKYVGVTVIDANDEEIEPLSITFDDALSLTVTFSTATLCNVVVTGATVIDDSIVPTGPTFPGSANAGTMFYLNIGDQEGLYIWSGAAWQPCLVNVSQLTNDAGYITETAIPTKVSQLTNDADYATVSDIPTDFSQLTNDIDLATVGQIPTKVSQLTNDSDYVTSASLPTVPTNVSAFTNDAGYVTEASLPIVPTKVSQLTNDSGFITAVSPALTGTPTAPTAAASDNSTTIATTAFVRNTIPTKLSQLTNDDGFITAASPALTGVPTAPTATNATNTTQLATTAFVQNLISSVAGGLNFLGTWNAATNTPTITSGSGVNGSLYKVATAGTTTIDGNSSWLVGDMLIFDGTTWDKIDGQATQVVSFNTRTGAITLSSSDVTTALGFTPISAASPALTGIPTAPTATNGTNTTQLATTAFVQNAVGGGSGFAPLNSPTFTGTPSAPTPTQASINPALIATTGYVQGLLPFITLGATTLTLASSQYSNFELRFLNQTGLTSTITFPASGEWDVQLAAGSTNAIIATNGSGTNVNFLSAGQSYHLISTASGMAVYSNLNNTVTNFNNRTGAVTLNSSDVTTALGFTPIGNASPTITGRVQSDTYSYTTTALGSISGNQTLDLASASEWSATITAATTFAFTNTLTTNKNQVVYLRLTNGGTYTITWPTGTLFAGGTAPVLTPSGTDMLGIKYDSTASVYMVFVIGLNMLT